MHLVLGKRQGFGKGLQHDTLPKETDCSPSQVTVLRRGQQASWREVPGLPTAMLKTQLPNGLRLCLPALKGEQLAEKPSPEQPD